MGSTAPARGKQATLSPGSGCLVSAPGAGGWSHLPSVALPGLPSSIAVGISAAGVPGRWGHASPAPEHARSDALRAKREPGGGTWAPPICRQNNAIQPKDGSFCLGALGISLIVAWW